MDEKLTLYGFQLSTFTQTAALALEEKGLPFVLAIPNIAENAYRKIHPFQKVPVLVHDDRHYFETLAIGIYVDEKFEGPRLQPCNLEERIQMFQWISVFEDYVRHAILAGVILERFVKPMQQLETDENFVQSCRPLIKRCVETLDEHLARSQYLAGPTYSLADMFYAPVMYYFRLTPEGREFLAKRARINAWLDRLAANKNIRKTCPQVEEGFQGI